MEDKYLWLEEIESTKALSWVKNQNQRTLLEFESLPDYKKNFESALSLYQSKDKLTYPLVEKNHIYNFWMDEVHIRGILRRTSLENYLTNEPQWEIVLDIDKLNKEENKSLVYGGMNSLPNSNRCLIYLSEGGKDANSIREFDLEKKEFVHDGFNLPESKGSVSWLDQDTLIIIRNFGEDSLTESGYPRIVKKLKRGLPLDNAVEICSIPKTYTFVFPILEYCEDCVIEVYAQAIDFFHYELFLKNDNSFIRLNLPRQISLHCIFHKKLIVTIDEDWNEWKNGSTISLNLGKILEGEPVTPELIMLSTEYFNVMGVAESQNSLIILAQEHMKARIYECVLDELGWKITKVDFPDNGAVSIIRSSDQSKNYFFSHESFNQPTTLYFKTSGQNNLIPAKILNAKFDTSKVKIEQKFVRSSDGTMIPYFIVFPQSMIKNGKNPTILYGYGGFSISKTPFFSNHLGKLWLEKGGVYVLANIRGGGEYGPRWHQSVQKQNRQQAFDDFFAVAKDLMDTNVTSPRHLGCEGGSNGGLLMGVCLTQRPELFRAIHCAVPLLDMLRFHKLLAGASWVAEYGSPDNNKEREYLEHYSPYHNLKKDVTYPKILFTTSTKDDRVHPGHARKMAALMEELNHPFYYYENIEGGHAGSADYLQRAQMDALSYSYFWKMLS